MALRFHRELEQKHYTTETDAFIRTALEHMHRQVTAFRGGPDAPLATPRDDRFADSADRYLESLDEAFAIAASAAPSHPHPFRSKFLTEFPQIIYNLATAIYQRLENLPYRFFSTRSPESRFAPSEVDLEYAVTIRAAEAVNGEYHDRLQAFYPHETVCHAPLVTLSGGPVAELYVPRYNAMVAALTTVPVPEDALISSMRHRQNLSCIKLPQWSSQHIRTYALAAHEHLHRVLNNALSLSHAAKKRFEWARRARGSAETNVDYLWYQKGLEGAEHQAIYEEYVGHIAPYEHRTGKALATLAVASYDFFQEIWWFYRDQKRAANAVEHGGQASELTEHEISLLRDAAHRHAFELLADIGAVLIAGPAFVFAFRTAHPITFADGGIAPERHSHPPTRTRVRFHIDLLRRLGFHDIPALLDDDLGAELKQLAAPTIFESAYEQFLASAEGVSNLVSLLIDHFTEHIAGTAGPTASYNLRYRDPRAPEPLSEAALVTRWRRIAYQVEDKRAILATEVVLMSPADTINAIWWKRIEEQSQNPEQEPRNRLAWRVALRNHGRLRGENAV